MARRSNGEIDSEAISRLVDIFGANNVAHLIDACLEDIEAALDMVLASSENGAPEGLRRGAHRLAGVLGQYACPGAAALAARIAADVSPDVVTQSTNLIALARRCQTELSMFRDDLQKRFEAP